MLHPSAAGLLLVDVLACDPGQTPALRITVQYARDLRICCPTLNSAG